MSLSASQQAAVQCDAARPLQILAGPGSGKTRVLTMRVAHLLLDAEHDARVLPQHCVVVTFTNKAANEMRTRLTALIGPERTQKLVLGTFHALCAMFLRRHGARIGIDHNFTIADTDDAYVFATLTQEAPHERGPRRLTRRPAQARAGARGRVARQGTQPAA